MHPLEQAADLIETFVEENLNRTSSICECCGMRTYEDKTGFFTGKELMGMVNKLRGRAEQAERLLTMEGDRNPQVGGNQQEHGRSATPRSRSERTDGHSFRPNEHEE